VGAVGVAGGDALRGEGAEGEDDGDGGEGEGCCFEVDEVSPFKRGEDDCGWLVSGFLRVGRERHTWDDHQDTVGHDEDLHGGECLVRW
jgi:hypothetical protein